MTDTTREQKGRLDGYDPTDPKEFIDPYPSWARARKEAPVFFDERLGFWQITRYDDVVAVTLNTRVFSSAKVAGAGYVFPENQHLLPRGLAIDTPSLANADSPEHNRVRRLCSEPFRPARISRLEPEIRQTADSLIDKFVDKGQTDLVAEFNVPFPLLVIASILGLSTDDIGEMARYSDELTASFNPQITMEQQRELFVHYGTFYDFCEAAVIRARKEEADSSLLSTLVQLSDSDQETLSEAELVSVVATIIVAGNETTRNLISNMLLALFRHPDQLEAVRERPDLAKAAVEETLRYQTSVKGLFRGTTTDVEIGGVAIPAGSIVQPCWASANRDEAVFRNADTFDIFRDDGGKHVGFGKGPHGCLGSTLARLEAAVALQHLLARLPDLRLLHEPEFPMGYLINPAISGLTRLDVAWSSRS